MKSDKDAQFTNLPPVAAEYIRLVIKKMGYRRKVREEVQAELIAHFEDALKDLTTEHTENTGKTKSEALNPKSETNSNNEIQNQKQAAIDEKVRKIIEEFGDAKLLGILTRRAKKRCRPWWRTAVVRCLQTIGIMFICLIFYCIYLSMGKPTISVNYVQRAQEIVRPVADESLNAAPLYQKAFELYVEEPNVAGKKLLSAIYDKQSIRELSPEELTGLKQWIADNNDALKVFKEATEKPYCGWKREAKDDVMLALLMPELSKMRSLGRLLCWRAKSEVSEGRIDGAFDDVLACYRSGMHNKGPRVLVEQLVGMAIESLACKTSFIILQEKDVDSKNLQNFQNEFEKLVLADTFSVNFEVEKFWAYDTIQRCFTDDGKGSGHFVPSSFKFLKGIMDLGGGLDGIGDSNVTNFTLGIGLALISADRQETMRKFENAYDKYAQWTKTTPWQKRQTKFNAERELGFADKSMIKTAHYPLYYILLPAAEKVIELSYRNKVGCEAVVLTVAVLRYKKEKGVYPDTLEQLVVAGYLKELLMDPYSDKTLVYKKYPRGQQAVHPTDATEDNFLLYTPGPDLIDHGGVVGEKGMWYEGGDAVFWPVEKPKSIKTTGQPMPGMPGMEPTK